MWSATSLNGTQAAVGWLPPAFDGGSPVTAYSVAATDTDTGALIAWVNLGPNARRAAVSGLITTHTYTIQVLAWNSSGPGQRHRG